MSRPNTAEILKAVTDAVPVLPGPLLSAAVRAVHEDGDNVALASLIRREDTPQDTAAKYATTEATAAAYHARARRDSTGPLETRASVLAKALRAQNPSTEVIHAAMAAFDRKPTRVLAASLYSHGDPQWLTPEQLATVLRWLPAQDVDKDGGMPPGWAARLGPDHAVKVLEETTHMWFVHALACYDLPVATLIEAFKRCIPHMNFARQGFPGVAETAVRATVEQIVCRRDPTTPVIQEFLTDHAWVYEAEKQHRDFSSTELGIAEKVIRPLKDLVRRGYVPLRSVSQGFQSWDTSPATPPTGTTALADQPTDALVLHAISQDPLVLADLVSELLNRPEIWDNSQLVITLLVNPALSVTDRHRLLSGTPEGRIGLELSQLDVISLFPEDPVAHREWARAQPSLVLSRHGWGPFGGRQEAVRLLRTWHAKYPPSAEFTSELRMLIVAASRWGLRPEEIRALEPRTLEAAISSGHKATAIAFAHMLHDAFGDNQDRWDTFRTLTPVFTGTVGELIDTVATIGT